MARSAEKLRRHAEELERKGRAEEALEIYRAIAAQAPDDPTAWLVLGDKELLCGRRPEAADAFFRSTDLFARRGLLRDALAACRRALVADRNHDGAHRLQVILERRLGDAGASGAPNTGPPGPPTVVVEMGLEADGPQEIVIEAEEPPEREPPEITIEPAVGGPAAAPARVPVPAPVPAPAPAPAPVPVPAPAPAPAPAAAAAAAPPDPLGPLERLVLSERFPTQPAAQAVEIALDEQPSDPFAPGTRSSPLASPLLGEVDNTVLQVLVDLAETRRYAKGQTVFRQGERGETLYVVLRGQMDVIREEAGQPQRRLASLRAGAFFGEMALITNEPRTATVTAAEEAEVLAIARPHVQRLIEADREVLRTLLRFFRARLVGTLVQTAPLFRGLSLLERRSLIARFRLRETVAGTVVIREGQPSDALCIALAGKLAVVRRDGAGERRLATLGAGDIFGEMSLLAGGPAVATIRTETKVWSLALPRRDFEQVIVGRPMLKELLHRLAAERRARNEAIRTGQTAYTEGRLEPI